MGKLQGRPTIIFFGTSDFAVPALKRLHESGVEIAAVVTQPDKPAGRKQEPLPSPIKRAALEMNLKVLQPENLQPTTYNLQPSDLSIVASYGKIIPKAVLDIPQYGALNIHPSLLPKYRGPSPIQAAILDGEQETGISIIKMDEEVDHGPIVAQSEKRKVQNKSYKKLHDELAEAGAELLIKILPDYLAGKIKPIPQDHSQATFTKIITKADARIDWTKSAEEIDRLVRAYSEWPVAWTVLEGKRLKIFEAKPVTSPSTPSPISVRERGEVIDISDGKILVKTADDLLEILDIQLEGSRRMSAKDFLNGCPNLVGKILK